LLAEGHTYSNGRIDELLIAKQQRRLAGFDDEITARHSRGVRTRKMRAHVRELFAIEVSPDLVSSGTHQTTHEEVTWQARPLGLAQCPRHWKQLRSRGKLSRRSAPSSSVRVSR